MDAKPPVKGDLTRTFQQKARRVFRAALNHDKIWDVPTKVIPFSRIERMAPARLTREQVWARDYNELSENEKDFYREHSVKVWEETGHKVKKKWKQPRELYEHVRAAFYRANGNLTSVVSFANYGQALDDVDADNDQPATGKSPFVRRDFAYVMIDDMHTADFMVESWIDPAAFESVRPKNINDDAFHYWILQHEFAHISGAGEAQADMMATVSYMKEFQRDDLPRLMADLRAVSTMSSLRKYAQIEDALENPKRLRDYWPLHRMRLKKALKLVAENLRTYGWGCVEGIDRFVGEGVHNAVRMDQAGIYALNKATTPLRNNMALELVREVNAHPGNAPSPGISLSETSFARNIRAYMADMKANGGSNLPFKARIKLDIAKRYLTAVDNLLIRDSEPGKGGVPAPVDARATPFQKRFQNRGPKAGPT